MAQQGFRYITPHLDAPRLGGNPADGRGYGVVVNSGELDRQIAHNPDPNFAYLQSLSVPDQNRYEQNFGICRAKSIAAMPLQVLNAAEFDRLKAMRRTADEKFAVDPRILQAQSAWVRCMRTDGWTFGQPGDAHSAIVESFNRLSQNANVAEAIADGAKPPVHGAFDPKILAATTLSELRVLEVAVAKSDMACMAKHVDKVYVAVRNDIESRLLAGSGP